MLPASMLARCYKHEAPLVVGSMLYHDGMKGDPNIRA